MSEVPLEAQVGAPQLEAKPSPAEPIERLRYLESYRFVFSSPNWFMNLLLGSVCLFIPVVGQIVFWGYEFELIDALHRGRRTGYADFDFNRFTDYLKRGVWPWLIVFMTQMILQPVLIVFMYAGMFGVMGALMTETTAGYVTAAVLVPALIIGLMIFSLALGLVLTPIVLRAGLTQDFAKAFDFAWVKTFIARMWVEQVLVSLFLMVSSLLWVLLGYLLFCIGVIPASIVVALASTHLLWQLYEIFLSRGGEPIPLKPQQ
jgi:hypothetical protein